MKNSKNFLLILGAIISILLGASILNEKPNQKMDLGLQLVGMSNYVNEIGISQRYAIILLTNHTSAKYGTSKYNILSPRMKNEITGEYEVPKDSTWKLLSGTLTHNQSLTIPIPELSSNKLWRVDMMQIRYNFLHNRFNLIIGKPKRRFDSFFIENGKIIESTFNNF